MSSAPTLPVAAMRVRARSRLRARLLPARRVAAGLFVVCGAAWLSVLSLDWQPALALIALLVAAAGALVPRRARWAQAAARAVLWATFVSGLAVGFSGNSLASRGALLVLPAGAALLLLSQLGRRLRGQAPMMFVATVLALADIGFHSLFTVFAFTEILREPGLAFFPAVALANVLGLWALRRWRTPWPHAGLNLLVAGGALMDVAGVKEFLNLTLAAVAMVQVGAALLATRAPPSPQARRRATVALRAVIALAMVASALQSLALFCL